MGAYKKYLGIIFFIINIFFISIVNSFSASADLYELRLRFPVQSFNNILEAAVEARAINVGDYTGELGLGCWFVNMDNARIEILPDNRVRLYVKINVFAGLDLLLFNVRLNEYASGYIEGRIDLEYSDNFGLKLVFITEDIEITDLDLDIPFLTDLIETMVKEEVSVLESKMPKIDLNCGTLVLPYIEAGQGMTVYMDNNEVVIGIGTPSVFEPLDKVKLLSRSSEIFSLEIFNDTIVWTEENNPGSNYDKACYVYDYTTHESPKLVDDRVSREPYIYGGKIFYSGWENNFYDIANNKKKKLEVWGGVAYKDTLVRTYGNSLWVYDLFTIHNMVTNQSTNLIDIGTEWQYKAIYKNRAVGISENKIYMCDIESGEVTQIAPNDNTIKTNLDIFKDKIVWQGDDNIYLYDIPTQNYFAIDPTNTTQSFPCIYGNIVVWSDARDHGDNGADIYMYYIDKEKVRRVTHNEVLETRPSVYKNKIIWQSNENGFSIYMTTCENITENEDETFSIMGILIDEGTDGSSLRDRIYGAKVILKENGEKIAEMVSVDKGYRFEDCELGNNYEIEPKCIGYKFEPSKLEIKDLDMDYLDQHFTGDYLTYDLGGKIFLPNGALAEDIEVEYWMDNNLDGNPDYKSGSLVLPADGSYTFYDKGYGQKCLIRPVSEIYNFQPQEFMIDSLQQEYTNINFNAAFKTFFIKGTLKDENGNTKSNYSVNLYKDNELFSTTVTDENGEYIFEDLKRLESYRVSVVNNDHEHTITPIQINIYTITRDYENQDFTYSALATGMLKSSKPLDFNAKYPYPAVKNGDTIYLINGNTLSAIGLDGVRKWYFTGVSNFELHPVIGLDGTIYVGVGEHPDMNNKGVFYAINPNGTKKWEKICDGRLFSNISSPCFGSDGTVYMVINYNLYAIDQNDGSDKWIYDSGSSDNFSCVPVIGSGDIIYVGDWYGKVFAINPDNTLRWQLHTGVNEDIMQLALDDNNNLIASVDNRVVFISFAGQKQWEFSTGDRLCFGSLVIGHNNTVYAIAVNRRLYALDLITGTKKWEQEDIPLSPYQIFPAVGNNGVLYLTLGDGSIRAINSDGTIKWTYRESYTEIVSKTPILTQDGALYTIVHTWHNDEDGYRVYDNGSLRAFQTESGGLAENQWPMYKRNANHTGKADDKIIIDSVMPLRVIAGERVSMTIRGVFFDTNASVTIRDSVIHNTNVISQDVIELDLTFNYDAPSGMANVIVTNPDGEQAIKYDLFEILDNTTNKYSINGFIRTSDNEPASNISVELNGYESQTTTTDENGYYIFSDIHADDYIIKPVHSGYIFEPEQKEYANLSQSHSNQDFVVTTPPGSVKWTVDLQKRIECSPAISDSGVLYIPFDDGSIKALNPDGSEKWTFDSGLNPYSNGAYSSPSLDSERGIVYMGDNEGYLYALNAETGSEIWSIGSLDKIRSTPVIDRNGNIYVRNIDGKIFAINHTNGSILWSYDAEVCRHNYSNETHSLCIGSGGLIYAGFSNGKLCVFDSETGYLVKTLSTGYSGILKRLSLGNDGTIYTISSDAYIYALKPNGQRIWRYYLGISREYSEPVIDNNNIVYVGIHRSMNDTSSYLVAINPNGTKKWEKVYENSPWNGWQATPVLGNNNVLYACCVRGYLYAINEDTGATLWRNYLGDDLESSPLMDDKGVMYVVTEYGKVKAIHTGASGPLNSAWPMYHRDINNTARAQDNLQIHNINPDVLYIGEQNSIDISGVMFNENTNISINNTALNSLQFISSRLLKAVVLPNADAPTGPVSITVTNSQNQEVQNIDLLSIEPVNSINYTISGYVKRDNGIGISNIEVLLSGDDSRIVTTNKDGYYEFSDILRGNYTITVSHLDYTFEPDNISFTDLHSNYENRDFTANVEQGDIAWSIPDIVKAPVIGYRGIIYSINSNKRVLAINKDGTIKWDKYIDFYITRTPAIGNDGTLYCLTSDEKVIAIEENGGDYKWEPLQIQAGSFNSDVAIDNNGILYFSDYYGKVFAVDTNTGLEKWPSVNIGERIYKGPTIGKYGKIYVGSMEGKLFALNSSDGSIAWQFNFNEPYTSSINAPTIGQDGSIYASSGRGTLVALDPQTGDEKWRFKTASNGRISAPVIGTNGKLYTISVDGCLRAFDPEQGTETVIINEPSSLHYNPIIGSNGNIYLVSDTKVFSIKPDGTINWERQYDNELDCSQYVMDSNGVLYVVGAGEVLCAIETDSNGYANTAWPMYGQNPQHTFDSNPHTYTKTIIEDIIWSDKQTITGSSIIINSSSVEPSGDVLIQATKEVLIQAPFKAQKGSELKINIKH